MVEISHVIIFSHKLVKIRKIVSLMEVKYVIITSQWFALISRMLHQWHQFWFLLFFPFVFSMLCLLNLYSIIQGLGILLNLIWISKFHVYIRWAYLLLLNLSQHRRLGNYIKTTILGRLQKPTRLGENYWSINIILGE